MGFKQAIFEEKKPLSKRDPPPFIANAIENFHILEYFPNSSSSSGLLMLLKYLQVEQDLILSNFNQQLQIKNSDKNFNCNFVQNFKHKTSIAK